MFFYISLDLFSSETGHVARCRRSNSYRRMRWRNLFLVVLVYAVFYNHHEEPAQILTGPIMFRRQTTCWAEHLIKPLAN